MWSSRFYSICGKRSPLLKRCSWRFSSKREVNSTFCLTSSAIISNFSSESAIFFQGKKRGPRGIWVNNKITVPVNHSVLSGGRKFVFRKLESSPTSIFSFSWFSPLNILIASLCQKLNPSASRPGVLSSHSCENTAMGVFTTFYTPVGSTWAYPDTANRKLCFLGSWGLPRRVLGASAPVRWRAATCFPDPWSCPCDGGDCTGPSGCPGPRFCSPRAEIEGFGIRRLEPSTLYIQEVTKGEHLLHVFFLRSQVEGARRHSQAYRKSKKSKAVMVSRTANCSSSRLRILTIRWMRLLTLSM